MAVHLWIGNRNYSSWSLRGWLCLRWAGIEFDETRIELDQPGYGDRLIADVRAVSPSGLLPALRVHDDTLWDTLAIAEWAAESARGQSLLPGDPMARALVRAAVGEMHAGFGALRRELPMNLARRCRAHGLSAAAAADVARIDELWSGLRRRYAAGGPHLFGSRSMADAFYLPVATRFRSYGIALSAPSQAYTEHILADADFQHWERVAATEGRRPFSRAPIDSLYPGTDR